MQFSLELPTRRVEHAEEFVTVDAVAEVTRAASEAGFAAVNVTDHPAPDTRWLDNGGHHALDPFVALAVAATADPSIRLHTNIYVAAYRNPFLGAKQVQSLDVLSGGRVILGVAAGYLKPEFGSLGVDFDQRGALLDDALDVLEETLGGADVTRAAGRYRARGVRFRPVRAGGRPPVWVGGNSAAARRRAARYDGWAPFHTGGFARASRTAAIESIEDLAAAIAEVRSLAASADPSRRFDVCWSEALDHDVASADRRCDRVARLADAGVTWMGVDLPGSTRAELVERIGAFGDEVIRETRGA